MPAVSPEVVLAQLRWRYATKKFDPTRRIEAAEWRTLEQALVLAPSSFGLQPWRFVVVNNGALRERLVAASWNQRQVADASHLVVFAARRDLGAADIDRYLRRVADVRGVTEESLRGFRQMLEGYLLSSPGFDAHGWAARQTYIAVGSLLTAAAMLGIDVCPMEGIEPATYDELLGLAGEGFGTVVAAAVGYRAADDRYATLPKVRFEPGDVIRTIG